MSLADLVFIGIAAVTILGALMAVSFKNVFYNALSLILCLFGVACLFIYLNSEFLAIMEVIIYIGAIAVAIIFAIMLSRPMARETEKLEAAKISRSFVIAAFLFAGLCLTLHRTVWHAASPEGDYSMRMIGKALLGWGILPFEAVSLVLLVAIIGALLLAAGKERSS
ncbi:MAG TPA: NADH-quinone oxidoreductase subunit J [Candidatus Eisenbacteria bacterium]|jgi:NADH-quinone oxidoreductase subunit J|nr:NADH-quinone oxidoreductase subunit J [Candidatus Eisenbacteria bacterium]